MILTEECIAIAEKVWGLNLQAEYSDAVMKSEGWSPSLEDWIQTEVNSWKGLGITVEAMWDKGYSMGTNSYNVTGWFKGRELKTFFDFTMTNTDTFIGEIHLAALEEIKSG